jgi:hypothetical protein
LAIHRPVKPLDVGSMPTFPAMNVNEFPILNRPERAGAKAAGNGANARDLQNPSQNRVWSTGATEALEKVLADP